ncbi:MAG TPA: formate dehydrogenase accessory sulfurtransferase FdhD [Ktedonobacterales bacterium]|nr:formate dehydrogenase accessory sulfurtransferase FdhD [Ktedonobacterales bacterium]
MAERPGDAKHFDAQVRSEADPQRQATIALVRVSGLDASTAQDELAVEEPLELRIRPSDDSTATESVAVIMRTPGADDELAAGFLFSEGLIVGRGELARILPGYDDDGLPTGNVLDIIPAAGTPLLKRIHAGGVSRAFAVNASCGVCGRNSIAAVCAAFPALAPDSGWTTAETLTALPERLREGQRVFDSTGGLHAAALFAPDGTLLALREDVGRHNAVDKLIGRSLLDGTLPLRHAMLLVSGRLSFEIVQKVVAAGIPLVAAVSAPSSLAVDLARQSGVTLVAFLRGASMNIYSHPSRVTVPKPHAD